MPVEGSNPVLRLGCLEPDAGNDRIRNFPREVGMPSRGKKHGLSDREPMGLHDAFLPRRARAGRNARTRRHLCGRCKALAYMGHSEAYVLGLLRLTLRRGQPGTKLSMCREIEPLEVKSKPPDKFPSHLWSLRLNDRDADHFRIVIRRHPLKRNALRRADREGPSGSREQEL